MITIVLGEHSAEDIALIQLAKNLGMTDEEIQKAYDRTLAEREGENETKILRQ